jgi:methionyl-tRNA formyltransferase
MSIGDNESAGELHDRMMDLGGKLVVDSIEKIAHGMVKTIPQSELSNSPVRPAPKLTKQNTQIDWSQDATSIHNLIRGLNPYPCAWTVWENLKGEIKNVKIQQTIVTEREGTGSLAITSDKHGVYIDTIGNVLELVSFQLEGKKKMTSKEWLAGNKATDWCVQSNEN